MIRVAHLTKRFPGHLAVDDVSFEVARGEIVGFLGPNGAGKTTTMRILTGYMPASGGEVSVAGRDVVEESREVRRRIGYLPEQCPLYPEMRVREYLAFRGRLKGVARSKLKRRVGEVVELCGLQEVKGRIIGQLSKGYRQRVGLAEALVHEPELLILDEPTIGLDPNQIIHVRGLIGELAKRHTILLSTHILPEVEVMCQRVLIINRGKVIASDTPETLRARLQGGASIFAELQGPAAEAKLKLEAIPGIKGVVIEPHDGWLHCRVQCDGAADPRDAIFQLVVGNGWSLRELRVDRKSLEDVFVALTRDAAPAPARKHGARKS